MSHNICEVQTGNIDDTLSNNTNIVGRRANLSEIAEGRWMNMRQSCDDIEDVAMVQT